MCVMGALAQDMSVENDIYGPPSAPVYVVYSTIPNNYGPYSIPYTIPYSSPYVAPYSSSYSAPYSPSYSAPVYGSPVAYSPSSSASTLSIEAFRSAINQPYVAAPVY